MNNGPFQHLYYDPETNKYETFQEPETVEQKLDRIITLLEEIAGMGKIATSVIVKNAPGQTPQTLAQAVLNELNRKGLGS